MKTAVFAFLGLVATAYSAAVDVESLEGVMASASGGVTAASAADASSGVASGALDGAGTVSGIATVGAALASAVSSPSL